MIVTFYSYKGGVGRSMALANVADLLARSGLSVLIIDFDLEAPGVEHFFPVEPDKFRGHDGLLDMLLTFKRSVSMAASDTDRNAYRDLERFVVTVYPRQNTGGGIDLMPAGRRLTDEELGRYGEELRRFDWLDFYFEWSGELFFEWLRRTISSKYDVVLVDSRTGVTEMGGVCAYQLADAIVVLCAANLQNVEGTEAMVRHFMSPQVQNVRDGRPLDVLVVPARVDQKNEDLRLRFKDDLERRFGSYVPKALTDAGLGIWDLQIPYEPRYAFAEQVVTDPSRSEERQAIAVSYGSLLSAISLLAPDDSRLEKLRPAKVERAHKDALRPVETVYDPTTRFVAPDVFLSYGKASEKIGRRISKILKSTGLVVAESPDQFTLGANWTESLVELSQSAKIRLILIGAHDEMSSWRTTEIQQLVSSSGPTIPVLLDDAKAHQLPPPLRPLVALQVSTHVNDAVLQLDFEATLARATTTSVPVSKVSRNPYPGLSPFREEDAELFFGRTDEVRDVLEQLRTSGACRVTGSAAVGKTSVIRAGVIPELRRGALPGSDRWPIAYARVGRRPMDSLLDAMTSLLPAAPPDTFPFRIDAEFLVDSLRPHFDRVVLVVDQFEETITTVEGMERFEFFAYLNRMIEVGSDLLRPIWVPRTEHLGELSRETMFIALDSKDVAISPLSPDELRVAIEEPAKRLGVAFEPGLVQRLLTDMSGSRAPLPLLQFVLHQLWEEQRDGFLTHRSYEQTGGPAEALARRAEAMFDGLSEEDEEIAKQVLLRLVEVGRGSRAIARPIRLTELTSSVEHLEFDSKDVARVVDTMTAERLIATSGRAEGVELAFAYEGLIQAWPRLAGWIDDHRNELSARSYLSASAREWEIADRDKVYLLSRDILEFWLSQLGRLPLSDAERAFVEHSEAQAKRASRRVWLGTASTAGISIFVTLLASFGASSGFIGLPVVAGIVVIVAVTYFVLRFFRD